MHYSGIDLCAALATVIGVWMCGVTRVNSLFWGLGLQTAALGLVATFRGQESRTQEYLILAGLVIVVKAVSIPVFLAWAAKHIGVRSDTGVILSPPMALLTACAAMMSGYLLDGRVAAAGMAHPGAAGMSIALLMIGMLLLLTRRLAMTQVIGFLVLENGIFLYGITQTHGIPLIIEMGVMLDVLVGTMIAGLVIFRLNRSFEHIDVTELRGLRE